MAWIAMGKSGLKTSAARTVTQALMLSAAFGLTAGAASAFPKPKYPISSEGLAPAAISAPHVASAVAAAPIAVETAMVTTAAPRQTPVTVSELAPMPAAERVIEPSSPIADPDDPARHRGKMRPPQKPDAHDRHSDRKKGAHGGRVEKAEASKPLTYSVRHGDTLSGVGRRFGVPVKEIVKLNKLGSRSEIKGGAKLKMPSEARDSGRDPHAGGTTEGGPPPKPKPVKAAPKTQAPKATTHRAPEPRYSEPVQQPAEPRPQVQTRPQPREEEPVQKLVPKDSGEVAATPAQIPSMTGHSILPPQPGQRLNPGQPGSGATQPARPAVVNPGQQPVSAPGAAATVVAGGGATAVAHSASSGRGRFIWPVKGELLSGYGTSSGGQKNDGVNIAAPAGSPVRAAAGGEVVYVGAYPGFGNLVLIKHGDGWVTDYGHLEKPTVHMRDKVTQGQQIGTVGQSGGADRPQLHFEVRFAPSRDVKAEPVDPQSVLPKND